MSTDCLGSFDVFAGQVQETDALHVKLVRGVTWMLYARTVFI